MKKIFFYGVIGGITILFFTHSFDLEARPSVVEYNVVQAAVEPKEILIEVHPAQLDRIADCESGIRNPDGTAVEGSARHFDKNGGVILGDDASVGIDVGWCQINTAFHKEKASELGLNIFEEEDNKTYCRKLYKEQGSQPWSASKSCWQ